MKTIKKVPTMEEAIVAKDGTLHGRLQAQTAEREAAYMRGFNDGSDKALAATKKDLIDAARYRWLRSRDIDAIHKGGIFAGKTPDNVVLSGIDLDTAIDAELVKKGES